MEKMLGKIVISKCGHDKDEIFIVVRIEKDFVFLTDGTLRTLEKLKKKNKKHIQIVNYIDNNIKNKIENDIELTNEDIKLALENYKNKNAKGE